MEKKWTKLEKEIPSVKPSRMAEVVKPAKIPSWTKSMSLEMYTRQIKIWHSVPGFGGILKNE